MRSRFTIISILFILFDLYAYFGIKGMFVADSQAQKIFSWTYWIVSIFAYLIALGLFTNVINDNTKFLQVYGVTFLLILMVSKLFMMPFFALDDIRRIFTWIYQQFAGKGTFDASRSRFLSTVGTLAGLVPGVAMLGGALFNAYRYKIRRIDIPVSDLHPDLEGYKIIQISDIHSGSFTFHEPIQHGIDLIKKENADLVVFTGDLVNTMAKEMETFISLFSQIRSAQHPTISITGNHDYGDYHAWKSPQEKKDNFTAFINTHRRLGWDLLMNEHRVIQHRSAKIGVIGVENFSALPQFPKYGNLPLARKDLPDVDFKLLLSHDPSHWDYEVNNHNKDIHLTLSGHTHGFQFGINIPGWLRWSPSQYVYKQWGGLYEKAGQFLYVNTGFGFLAYAGRVGFLPEITVFTLRQK